MKLLTQKSRNPLQRLMPIEGIQKSIFQVSQQYHSRSHFAEKSAFSSYVSSTINSSRRPSSSSSHYNLYDRDKQEDVGTIEGVWVFHRHGDRAPSEPLCTDEMLDKESSFWKSKLPESKEVKSLSKRFPPKIHPSNGEPLDSKKFPYGFLTRIGASQMYKVGRKLGVRYNQQGYHIESSSSSQKSVSGENCILENWNIQVFSTNYLRTVTSAQFFLKGLLQQHQEEQNHNTSVPINVRSRYLDTLNAFDKNPEKMRKLVSGVVSSPEFQERDQIAISLATLLTRFLPGLAKTKKTYFGGPSGINWIHASDHFVCRAAHGVRLTCIQSSSKKNSSPSCFDDDSSSSVTCTDTSKYYDPNEEELMKSLAEPTKSHLAWRFSRWYKEPSLLSAIAAPPLREIEVELRKTPFLDLDEKRPLCIFSCHDVTILSILYGLGADKVKDDLTFWPPYASTLIFELVKVDEDDGILSSRDGDKNGKYFVRVLLNGKIVEINTTKEKKRETDGEKTGEKMLLSLEDFSSLVMDLEKKGFDEDHNVDTDSIERDMAGWTG